MSRVLERPSVARSKKLTLIDGDALSVEEFLRRYELAPPGFRAELLNGIVHVNSTMVQNPDGKVIHTMMSSPRYHGRPQFNLVLLLGAYQNHTPGIEGICPSALVLPDGTSVPEPDLLLCIETAAGGGTHEGSRDAIYGVPELVVEISNTSESKDLGEKKRLYERNGVPEYLVWRTRRKKLLLFNLQNGEYAEIAAASDGVLKSQSFPGLWFNAPALAVARYDEAMRTLELGLASPEHAKFVEKLRKVKARRK